MPYKAKKPCGHRGCPKLTRERYCEEHAKLEAMQYNRFRRDPDTDKRYSGGWKKIRAAFLKANPLCELCSERGRFTPATLVHHKRKVTDGGTNETENLQALCASCHSNLHAGNGDYFKTWITLGGRNPFTGHDFDFITEPEQSNGIKTGRQGRSKSLEFMRLLSASGLPREFFDNQKSKKYQRIKISKILTRNGVEICQAAAIVREPDGHGKTYTIRNSKGRRRNLLFHPRRSQRK